MPGPGAGPESRYAWASEDEDSELSSDGEGVIFGTSPPARAAAGPPRAEPDPPQALKSLGRGRGRAPGGQEEEGQPGDGGLDAGAPEATPSASEPEAAPSASEPEATPSASEPEPVFRAMTASKLRQSLRRSFSDELELELERAKPEGPGDGGGGPPPGVKAASGASSPWANLDRILAGIETAQRSSGKMGALYARLRELQGIHLGLTGHEEELRLAHAGLAAERRHYLALLRRIEDELVPNDHLDDADKRLGGRLEDIIYSVDNTPAGAVHLVGAKGRAIDYRALSARGVLDARLLRLVLDRGA